MVEPRSAAAERVREVCRKLKPLLGERVNRLFMAYAAEDDEGKKQIESYLDVLVSKHLDIGLDRQPVELVPPPSGDVVGAYPLGTVLYAGKSIGTFGLREHEWIQHVGVFGRSGAGKTNLGFEIFRQLLLHGKPVLVFDWKRNYRDLLVLPEFKEVEVYTVGRNIAPLRFNPLIPPPATDAKVWLKAIIEVVAHAYCLGNGVLYLLQESLDAVYKEHGVYDGHVDEWPTFRDVLNTAKERNARGRESAWLSSTLRALASLCFGEMDKMLNTPQDQVHRIDRLLTTSTILEMDALGQADKVFLISALLLYIHHRRMAEGEREHFKHAVIIEEAHHLLSDERRSLIGGQSVMEITFREIREFGESIVILDQHPSKISLSALGNTYCTICLNLKHQKDVNAMAQSMLLESAERDIFGSLEVGQAVVKLQGRAPRPFFIAVPEFELKKGLVTDRALELKMAHLVADGFPVTPTPGSAPYTASPSEKAAPVTGPLHDGRMTAFMRDVLDFPASGVAARYQRIHVSVRQGQKLKKKLAEVGLIEEGEEYTKTGRICTIRLTEKGVQCLGQTDWGREQRQDGDIP